DEVEVRAAACCCHRLLPPLSADAPVQAAALGELAGDRAEGRRQVVHAREERVLGSGGDPVQERPVGAAEANRDDVYAGLVASPGLLDCQWLAVPDAVREDQAEPPALPLVQQPVQLVKGMPRVPETSTADPQSVNRLPDIGRLLARFQLDA